MGVKVQNSGQSLTEVLNIVLNSKSYHQKFPAGSIFIKRTGRSAGPGKLS
jgi:hypothetical protein